MDSSSSSRTSDCGCCIYHDLPLTGGDDVLAALEARVAAERFAAPVACSCTCHVALPALLFWVDCETSGTDPQADALLELAFVVTKFAAPYSYMRLGGTMLFPSGLATLRERGTPYVQQMHAKSGLTDELTRIFASVTPPISADDSAAVLTAFEDSVLLPLSDRWPGAEERMISTSGQDGTVVHASADEHDLVMSTVERRHRRVQKVVVAGFSTHFDLQFLRAKFPRFAKRLSHRVFDVSAQLLLCQSLGMPYTPLQPAAHRAQNDLDASMRVARECGLWMRHQVANGAP